MSVQLIKEKGKQLNTNECPVDNKRKAIKKTKLSDACFMLMMMSMGKKRRKSDLRMNNKKTI